MHLQYTTQRRPAVHYFTRVNTYALLPPTVTAIGTLLYPCHLRNLHRAPLLTYQQAPKNENPISPKKNYLALFSPPQDRAPDVRTAGGPWPARGPLRLV